MFTLYPTDEEVEDLLGSHRVGGHRHRMVRTSFRFPFASVPIHAAELPGIIAIRKIARTSHRKVCSLCEVR